MCDTACDQRRADAIRELAEGCVFRLLSLGLPESAFYEARELIIARIENYHDRLTCGEWPSSSGHAVTPLGGFNRKALLARGWTAPLIRAVLGTPDRTERHARGYMQWKECFWSVSRVTEAERDPRFIQLGVNRKQRAARAKERREGIPHKYAGWRQALPECAAALFSLNRYAKHQSCSVAHRTEIYQLKDELIEALWTHGYCALSWIHRLQLPEQKCRECAGGDWDCSHCGGSGVWKSARTLEFWCFEFRIGEKKYCWHQPREQVDFEPVESVPPQDWAGTAHEKPVVLSRNKFAMAKELIRWVLGEAAAESVRGKSEAVPFGAEAPDNPDHYGLDRPRPLHTSAGRLGDLL